ncbi:uncharacterized protein LOC144599995 isoform X2 [Rhinoraja longicauda]
MDHMALLDLLECPVCFERLDGTAKVLPCQHTFCRTCLQQISHSHKEVHCPECRSPVTCSIDDLPANLLLVRLLDGIRYGQTNARPTPPPADQHQGSGPSEPVNSLHSGLVKTPPPAHGPLEQNNILKVIRRVDENWAEGKLGDRVGIFPVSFVEMNSTAKQLLSVKGVDVKGVQSHSSSSPTVGNPRPALAHGETGNPSRALAHGEVGNPRPALAHMETGNPRRALTHGETGNPSPALAHGEVGNPRPALAHGEVGNPRPALAHVETGNPSPALTHAETGKTGSKASRRHAGAVNTLSRTCQPSLSLRSLHISPPVLISTSNPAVLAQMTENRALPTQMLHGLFDVGVSAPGTSATSSQCHPETVHPRPQVPITVAGVTETSGPLRPVAPARGQDVTLTLRTDPCGQQEALTSPASQHVYGTGYRPNVQRPTLAVPPVQSQSGYGRCAPAVVIQAQPFPSRQLPQRVVTHTIHASPLAATCRPVPIRPMPSTTPPPPPPGAVRQVQQACTATPGSVTAPTSTPPHANEDTSGLNKAVWGPGASLPPSPAWITRPRLQPTTTSLKPELGREEMTVPKALGPTASPSRAASCPITSQQKVEVVHHKTGSWDACYRCTSPSPLHSSTVEEQPRPAQTPSTCLNRCRAVLARGEVEPRDIMLVQRRRPDGCYQDNHAERGHTESGHTE